MWTFPFCGIISCHISDYSNRSNVSKILQITYGYTPKADDDFLIKMIEDVMNDFCAASNPGTYLVDFLPICKWLECLYACCLPNYSHVIVKHIPGWMPGTHFQRFAEEASKKRSNAELVPFQMVKKKVVRRS